MRPVPVTRIRLGAACAVLASLLAATGGCSAMLVGDGGSAGRPIGTSGASRASAADRRIAEIIRRRYAADAGLAASEVQVSCVAGVVTLRGQVSDYPLRDRAVRLARDVEGVSRVSVQIGIAR